MPSEGKKIDKPEDKAWEKWFNELGDAEHKKHLAQLGLDEEDVEDWKGMHGQLDEIIAAENEAAEDAENTKKKKK